MVMDEIEQASVATVGERLRAAREEQGMSLEQLAATTRIPTRHLESLENSNWAALPAPTYSMGFAKNYAGAVGLDRAEIADQLREEMGGTRPTQMLSNDLFEPADPKRAMPRGLVIGAIIALVLVAIGLTWLSNRNLSAGDDAIAATESPAAATDAPVAVTPVGPPPVVITANAPAWIEVRDGDAVLVQRELALGQSYEVPASAAAPTLTTAKPESLRISVGTADAPQVGPAGRKVSGVSLKGPALLKGPSIAPAATVPARQTVPTAPRPRTPVSVTPAPPPVVTLPNTAAPASPTSNTSG